MKILKTTSKRIQILILAAATCSLYCNGNQAFALQLNTHYKSKTETFVTKGDGSRGGGGNNQQIRFGDLVSCGNEVSDIKECGNIDGCYAIEMCKYKDYEVGQ